MPYATTEGVERATRDGFGALLESELRTRELELEVIPLAREEPRHRDPAEGLRMLAAGRRQLAAGELAQGAQTLRRGVAALLSEPATAPMGEVIDALVEVGVTELRRAQERQARAAFAQVARLAPWYRLRGRKYPPVVLREFSRTRQRVLGGATGTLVVEAPPGSTVSVDGRAAVKAPARVARLPRGTHYVRVVLPDGSVRGAQVELKRATAKVTIEAPLKVAPPELGRTLTAQSVEALGQYTASVGAGYALVGALGTSGAQLRAGSALFDAATGALHPLLDVAFSPDLVGANVAALKLGDAVLDRIDDRGAPAELPLDLLSPRQRIAVATAELTPPAPPAPHLSRPPMRPAEQSWVAKVPPWVWAAGAGLVVVSATTAGVLYANRPVTGTVTATW